ncbi:MAG: hypothetical protein GEU87_18535 [Alphaproteobacteria bacterium]|nr:hypothetical protein [Alphaproteobacteria bacterium]
MSDRIVKLARARDYPYLLPDRSYVWRGGSGNPMQVEPFDPALTAGRTPVLAVGSNQSPLQLARKYGVGSGHMIPVERARLEDFDIVYAAHISSYGAVPSMLQCAPGVEVTLFVTWLDDAQLEIMHATEGNYHFAEIENVRLRLEGGGERRSVCLYVARLGHFVHEGRPVSLKAMQATGRVNGVRDTAEMLRLVQQRLAHDGDHDDFCLRLADDLDFRRACIGRLAEDSVAFGHPFRIVGP